ncbi:MAG TPA: sugar-specific transcriptional regulator TrmB [Methanocorpusculum sp.]|nr:sugar-specific transcriptional regulator TrmB [Methanocorpusculum sp.]
MVRHVFVKIHSEDPKKTVSSFGGMVARRGQFLQMMLQMTFESGYFTTAELAEVAMVPRSTAQDWINRLLNEGCIFIKEAKHGRSPARYASRSAMPSTTCRRIFTTVDGDDVSIYHECLSSGCAGFCEFHHRKAGGAALSVARDGMLFQERSRIGITVPDLNLENAAVGLAAVRRDGETIVQTICSIYGGPAYSLSSMMGQAKGVCGVSIRSVEGQVIGEVRTRALVHVTVGIDDTDRDGCGGATFALAQALLKYITESGEAIGIRHQVAMLSRNIEEKTAGNSCSFLELAVEPDLVAGIVTKISRFVEEESVSEHWGIAIARGLHVPQELMLLSARIRSERVTMEEVLSTAERYGIETFGGRGVIGAVAAVALRTQSLKVLLDPEQPLEKG